MIEKVTLKTARSRLLQVVTIAVQLVAAGIADFNG
jgi:hypothetical protein